MRKLKLFGLLLVFAGLTTYISCNDDDEEPEAVRISTIIADGTDLSTGQQTSVDLNTATAATGVPVDPVITITFDKNVDATTATASNITLNDGDADLNITVAASGADVTVTLSEDLARGTEHTLGLSASIKAEDGGTFSGATRTFTTAGRKEVTPPQVESMVAYWKFDGDASDETGNYADGEEISMTYGEDRFGNVSSSAQFDGDESIIEIGDAADLIDTDDFTISFWYKTNSDGHVNADGNPAGNFVLGLGAFYGIQYEISGNYQSAKFAISYVTEDGTGVSEDMWFPANATDLNSGGWQGWTYAQSISEGQMEALLKDHWLHVVYTYDAAEKVGSLYYDGVLRKTFDFDLWPEDAPKRTVVGLKYRGAEPDVVDDLAFGFIHSRAGTMWDNEPWGGYDFPTANHFKGNMDDVRIFHAALTESEVEQLYEDESP
jgi:hypothetical protein